MFIKLTDKRPIVKQIVSGICWTPVAVIGLCVVALVGLMTYGIVIIISVGRIMEVLLTTAKSVGIMALILGYAIAFTWSNQN